MTRRYDTRDKRERSRTTRETTSTVERTRLLDTIGRNAYRTDDS